MESDKASIPSSPYLTAIQSIPGQTPGAKYKHINALIKEHVDAYGEKIYDESDFEFLKDLGALHPFVAVQIADKLHAGPAIAIALKSKDPKVGNKALQAKWFFQSDEPYADADFYEKEILPFVSYQTRRKIVKNLSYSLEGTEAKAESFFELFRDLYGPDEAKPFLLCCKSGYAFKAILDHKIVLSSKMLEELYRRRPKLALRYLYLGLKNEHNCWAELHKIRLSDYASIVTDLLPRYPEDFRKLARDAGIRTEDLKLKSSRVRTLVKRNPEFVITNAKFVINICCKLSDLYNAMKRKDFERLYENLLPRNRCDFDLGESLGYLKYYPRESRWKLIKDAYERKYGFEFNLDNDDGKGKLNVLLTNIELSKLITLEQYEAVFERVLAKIGKKYKLEEMMSHLENYPKEKRLDLLTRTYRKVFNLDLLKDVHFAFFKSEKLLMILPEDKRWDIVDRLIGLYQKNSDKYFDLCVYLPPERSFPIFKEAIEESSLKDTVTTSRMELIKKLVRSCKLYNDQRYLHDFLVYYNVQRRNDGAMSKCETLDYLMEQFKIKDMDDKCWSVFYEIFARSFVKGELGSVKGRELINNVLRDSLDRLLANVETKGDQVLDKLVDAYLEYEVEMRSEPGYKLDLPVDVKLKVFDRVLLKIGQKYPDDHAIWRKQPKSKLRHATRILEELCACNAEIKSSGNLKLRRKRLVTLDAYPWLKDFVIGKLLSSDGRDYEPALADLVKKFSKKYYLKVINEARDNYKESISTGVAQKRLNRDNWTKYLTACREQVVSTSKIEVASAKKFLRRIRWHNEWPLCFVERCAVEVKRTGSLEALSILLDGETLSGFLLRLGKINANQDYELATRIAQATKMAQPPVSVTLLVMLCSDARLAVGPITNYGVRVEKPKAVALTELLMLEEPSIVLKKQAVLLAFKVMTYEELKSFLTTVWCESHQPPSVGKMVAREVRRCFVSHPSERTWSLVETCVAGLRRKDCNSALEILSRSNDVDRRYAAKYVKTMLDKVEELAGDDFANQKWKEKWIVEIVGKVPEKVATAMPKDVVMEIMRRYYFRAESVGISRAAGDFAQSVFNRSKLVYATT